MKHVQFKCAQLSSHCRSKTLVNRYRAHNLDWDFTKSRCIFCETKNRTSGGEHLQNGQKGFVFKATNFII